MSIEATGASQMSLLNRIYQMVGRKGPEHIADAIPTNEAKEDSLTLSSTGQSILERASLFDTEPGQPVTLDSIATFGQKKLASFETQFRALLRDNGIDTSTPITLGHEFGTGRVVVTNDHPDAEKIETLVNGNPKLRNTYTAATNALELVRHATEHGKFSEAYAADPQMAVAQYAYLFNTRWDASVTFSADGFSVAYNRAPRL